MNVTSVTILKAFLNNMATVGGGVDKGVICLCGGRALKGGLQHTEVIVALVKRQVVYKYNELKRIFADLAHNVGEKAKLILS